MCQYSLNGSNRSQTFAAYVVMHAEISDYLKCSRMKNHTASLPINAVIHPEARSSVLFVCFSFYLIIVMPEGNKKERVPLVWQRNYGHLPLVKSYCLFSLSSRSCKKYKQVCVEKNECFRNCESIIRILRKINDR